MKTKYKFIHFVDTTVLLDEAQKKQVGGKSMFECRNNKSFQTLGGVAYYPQWRQFVFYAASKDCVFNNSCLADIQDFLNQCNKGDSPKGEPR